MNSDSFAAGCRWLAAADHRRLASQGLRGLEKECLRVARDGRLSTAPHSERFGSALTHPWLTTDYSEALLEFVTPPFPDNGTVLSFLADLHAFVVQSGGNEVLWPASMPCHIDSDEAVPIAQYGPSNAGRMRTVYRSGLGFRYGRAMQAIAGTHFNFSLPEPFWPAWRDFRRSSLALEAFKSESLMGLARNFRRCGWLLTYLYGASPAFSKSFRPEGHARLQSLDEETWYAPEATSLRMSDMGYRNSTQSRLAVSLNSLDEYLSELGAALSTPDSRYAAIGVDVDGEYRQLNANILQLENEYYSSIRPKPAASSERLITALATSGVEYVEVRTLDLNPFEPLGIAAEQARLVELLLLYCTLSESPPISASELDEIDLREITVAWVGRRPGLKLSRGGRELTLMSWGLEILDALDALAALLDDGQGRYAAAVTAARRAVRDPDATLSARVLGELRAERQPFFDWAMARAERYRDHFLAYEFAPGRLEELRHQADESLRAAARIEAADALPFAEYLTRFMGQHSAREHTTRP